MNNTFRKFENRLDCSMIVFMAHDASQAAEFNVLVCCNAVTQVWETKSGSMSVPARFAADVSADLAQRGWTEV